MDGGHLRRAPHQKNKKSNVYIYIYLDSGLHSVSQVLGPLGSKNPQEIVKIHEKLTDWLMLAQCCLKMASGWLKVASFCLKLPHVGSNWLKLP